MARKDQLRGVNILNGARKLNKSPAFTDEES
jgi:hypothetical protein